MSARDQDFMTGIRMEGLDDTGIDIFIKSKYGMELLGVIACSLVDNFIDAKTGNIKPEAMERAIKIMALIKGKTGAMTWAAKAFDLSREQFSRNYSKVKKEGKLIPVVF